MKDEKDEKEEEDVVSKEEFKALLTDVTEIEVLKWKGVVVKGRVRQRSC